jgi:hypothetical protein
LIDNPASKILVMEKVLAERSRWRNPYFSKRGSYVRELHVNLARCARDRRKLIYLFTKFCEQNARAAGTYSQVIQWI